MVRFTKVASVDCSGGAYIVIGIDDGSFLLNNGVEISIDDSQSIEVKVVSMFHINSTIENLFILLLEEAHESRSIMSTIAFSPHADAVIIGLVAGEFGEKGLSKVPQSMSSLLGAVGGLRRLLAWKGADAGGEVDVRRLLGKVGWNKLGVFAFIVNGIVGRGVV